MEGTSAAVVDVLLPVRLPAPWLDEALEGLRSQTNTRWRLVCVVHGPPGDVPKRARQVDPTAVVVMMPETATLVEVLNAGLAQCSAKFVARLDADDIPEPDRLLVQSTMLDAHPEVGLVCSAVTWIDESGSAIRGDSPTSFDVITGLRWKNVIAHPTVMARRELLEELGGYDVRATQAEDYELWLRLAARAGISLVAEPLLKYRVHGQQVTRTKAIPKSGRASVGEARVALARARRESTLAARLRQAVWVVPQVVRGRVRRSY